MSFVDDPHPGTALITGASSGIGTALAELFASRGHGLVLVARDGEALKAIAARLGAAHGVGVHVIALDLTRADAAAVVAQELAQTGIAVSILVNNAGIGLHGRIWETDADAERRVIDLQIATVIGLTRGLLPGMIARRRGRILNIASVYSFVPVPFQAAYGASKAFMFAYSAALAEELRGTGVTVTVAAPGTTQSAFRQRAGVAERRTSRGMPAADVAAAAYDGMMAGRLLVVPGAINRLFLFVLRWLPHALTARLMRRINVARRLEPEGPGES